AAGRFPRTGVREAPAAARGAARCRLPLRRLVAADLPRASVPAVLLPPQWHVAGGAAAPDGDVRRTARRAGVEPAARRPRRTAVRARAGDDDPVAAPAAPPQLRAVARAALRGARRRLRPLRAGDLPGAASRAELPAAFARLRRRRRPRRSRLLPRDEAELG